MSEIQNRTKIYTEEYSNEESINKINKIISRFKVYIFQKYIKNLIKKHKQNYIISSTLNENNLKLLVFYPEQIKEYKVEYEPILYQTIAYIPKEDCKNRLLLKFNFINNKNESIIDPKYNNEFNDGIFLNTLNLKKILEKEEERKEDFQDFLETYFTSNNISKEIRKYFLNSSSNDLRKIKKKLTLTTKGPLTLKKIVHKKKTEANILSILKPRSKNRIPSDKRISFGNVTKLEYYVDKI